MNEIRGAGGELVERLIEAVNSRHAFDWLTMGHQLVFAIGGRELVRITPDTGSLPAPGSYGERRQRTHEVVSRDVYFHAIRHRLLDLVASGVREDVLVRALRNELTRQAHQFADGEGANARRKETRERFDRAADDPAMLADLRERMAKLDPEVALWSDDQVAENVKSLAQLLGPIPPEVQMVSWLAAFRWEQQVAALVSDAALAEWLDRWVERGSSQG